MPGVLALAPPPLLDQSVVAAVGAPPIPMRMWWLTNQINPVPLDGHADAANSATADASVVVGLAGHADAANGAGTSVLSLSLPLGGHADAANSAGTSILSALRKIDGHADAANGATGDARVAYKIISHADAANGATGDLTVTASGVVPVAGHADAAAYAGAALTVSSAGPNAPGWAREWAGSGNQKVNAGTRSMRVS